MVKSFVQKIRCLTFSVFDWDAQKNLDTLSSYAIILGSTCYVVLYVSKFNKIIIHLCGLFEVCLI